MEPNLLMVINRAIQEKVMPGASIGIYKNGKVSFVNAGTLTYESQDHVDEHTRYDVASITKSIPLGSLLGLAIQEGKLSLDDRAQSFLPKLSSNEKQTITIKHLATYTAVWDLPLGLAEYGRQGADAVFKAIYELPLKAPAGSIYHYTNIPAILIGLILESCYEKPLDILANEKIFKPLKMLETSFKPNPETAMNPIAPSEINERGEVRGVVHDESAFALRQAGYAPGNAGVFSTTHDLMRFCSEIIKPSMHVFSEKTLRLFEENAVSDVHASAGIGWELNRPNFMGEHSHESLIGKTGFTGCFIVIDRKNDQGFALLTNAQHPKRHQDRGAINKMRSAVSNIILQ